jgi:hypothetical protein
MHWEMGNAYILVQEDDVDRQFRGYRHCWENIQVVLKESWCGLTS